MKKLLFVLLLSFLLTSTLCLAQSSKLHQNFLFDDSDIIVKASSETKIEEQNLKTEENIEHAISSARNLLQQQPTKLQQKTFSKSKIKTSKSSIKISDENKDAPFGLLWKSSIADTQKQGVKLSAVEMKDYTNSFLANNLPKPISFFTKIYAIYGKEDQLYRILAYSQLIEDDNSASKILDYYKSYSELLNKKYGNKEEDFTPAVIKKTIKNSKGQDEIISEDAPIGNPDFLSQLQAGTAVLFSTYYNQDVAAALSIGVDGDKKSYIVIDYKNLQVLQKQEAKMLDAL